MSARATYIHPLNTTIRGFWSLKSVEAGNFSEILLLLNL